MMRPSLDQQVADRALAESGCFPVTLLVGMTVFAALMGWVWLAVPLAFATITAAFVSREPGEEG